MPLDPHRPAAGLVVRDPRTAARLAEAEARLDAARPERDAYARPHAVELHAECHRAAMDRVRAALGGDDRGELADALRG